MFQCSVVTAPQLADEITPLLIAAEFWKYKSLYEMSNEEWEALCDGCGKCCICKLQDEETGAIALTNVACKLLDIERCTCTDYANRAKKVPECLVLTPAKVKQVSWLPSTCAYRLVDQGKDLPDWHPLLTAIPDSAIDAGHSMSGRLLSEAEIDDLVDHIVDWRL